MSAESQPCEKSEIASPAEADGRRPGNRNRSAILELAKRLGLTAATLVVLALVLEFATRLFSDTPAPLLINDPVLGRRYVANYRGEVYVKECQRDVFIRSNRDGLRGEDLPYEKPPGVKRLAVIGDSMTAAFATDEDKTFVRQLESMLNESDSGRQWQVMNFGVSGSSTGQELVMYREVVRRYDPDVVLCAFYVGNDLADNCGRLSHNNRIYFDLDENDRLVQQPYSAARAKSTGWLNRHSRFYVWQKAAVQAMVSRVAHKAEVLKGGRWIFCASPDGDVRRAWEITERLIAAFKNEVESDGARFGLVVIPSCDQVYDDVWAKVVRFAADRGDQMARDYPDQRLCRLCDSLQVPVTTATDRFREAAPGRSTEEPDQWLYHNGGQGHLNDRGNRIVAEATFGLLQTKLLRQTEPKKEMEVADGLGKARAPNAVRR